MLGLYLHIPFCQAICSYCNFNRGLLDPGLKTRYVAAIEREILDAADGRRVDTIFFGGGTPSLLEPAEIRRLLGACREAYRVAPGAEVTLETNPETALPDRLAAFRDAGITRLSIGVQSFDDDELGRLGRIHSAARARSAVAVARAARFPNVSLDVMFWLPGQSLASWMRTVDQAIELGPDHLSLYLLELYPNAPLKEAMARAGRDARAAADWCQSADETAADMYLKALDRLDAAGFEQYEISNVARPGFLCRHNVKYWQGGAWRGFGAGAHSTDEGRRWQNVAATIDYADRIERGRSVAIEARTLSEAERIEEALFTGLRLAEGIDRRNFLERYGVDPWARYGDALTPFVEGGLMWTADSRFGLTRRGMLVANDILVTFV
jgi:oxygen-independent coproporphyrinogen-3 oxidase